MEKLGLFDLIEKFNAQANGKRNLVSSPQKDVSTQKTTDEKEEIQPLNLVPTHYAMNVKLQEFYKKHDSLSKQINK